MATTKDYPKQQPPQHQEERPGHEHKMKPPPVAKDESLQGSKKLQDKVALISGGDSGIGRAVALAFAREGAKVAILYLNEEKDANETKSQIEATGQSCLTIKGDIGNRSFCHYAVGHLMERYGKLDVLINNAAEQHPQDSILQITEQQLEKTFRTNIFSFFFMVQAALPHMKAGSCIINTTSVTAYRGSAHLLDYSSTKGAIVAFTRSLSQALADKEIRVNMVAPGPIWTPLIPSTFSEEEVAEFGSDTPMKRAGQPEEVASCFVFLASSEASYMTGQCLHPNGGEMVNG